MNKLSKSLTQVDIDIVNAEIVNLFFAQNEMLIPEKKKYLFDEIIGTGYPIKAIVTALKQLQYEDLKRVKLSDIISTIRDVYVPPQRKDECNLPYYTDAERERDQTPEGKAATAKRSAEIKAMIAACKIKTVKRKPGSIIDP